ncbi:hypothetical protein [Chryseobacterium daeguense]|uniref:hypothetical protein n=1 Tax=Chryseobacterium daeguense TaxID=412438 RepID=UPI0003FB5999|nr:hypothetical protein [Chryseobacterium daeguense]
MKKIIIISLFLVSFLSIHAQKSRIGIGTSSPQAVLDVVSNKNGVLIPRQTAAQIQGIQAPQEGELVYALTDDGIAINRKGFWFYHLGVWNPLTENTSGSTNIYTVDGAFTSERQLTQNGMSLNFGPGLLFINGNASTMGIATASPTQALDVAGDVRLQDLAGTGAVLADADGVLIHDTAYFDVGDVKPSYAAADHDGWYLLDGRDISSLPTVAQNNATAILGITTALPNAADRNSIGSTSAAPGTVTGSNTITLTRANLPLFNFVYTTNNTGAHTHTMTYQRILATSVNGGGNNIHAYWLSGTLVGGSTYSLSSASSGHNHTYSLASGGIAEPVDIRPSSLNFNYFIYLGN